MCQEDHYLLGHVIGLDIKIEQFISKITITGAFNMQQHLLSII